MDGVLVIDKPVGPTSHDVVARVRRAFGERRVGHTGTLDPAASGVLALVIGRATRLARFLSASDKSYDARVRLGISTETDDACGRPVGIQYSGAPPSREAIESALDVFRGSFLQRPPAYSAKKIGGRRSYAIARARARESGSGDAAASEPVAPVPQAVTVTAHRLEIIALDAETVTLQVECSAGFYVRSLAHDLGERLGIGGHLSGLRRTASGDFTLAQAIPLDAVERDPAVGITGIVPLSRLLPRLAFVVLTAEGANRAAHGRDLGPGDLASGTPTPAQQWVRLLDRQGDLVGVARPVTLLTPVAPVAPLAPLATTGPSSVLHPAVVLK